MAKRVHILSAVNAANVSKSGATYTIRDVCGAVDGIVMNGMLYPGDQLAAGVASLEGKPAPAGHPKNSNGQHISALNGEALASAWIGSYARNARHEGGRTLVDVVVNETQARAHPDGAKLIDRLDAAIAGTDAEPINVSTGLFVDAITANGESRGKKYQRIATSLRYDHIAILLNESGAGTPEDGVGMFLNSAGQPEEVESVSVADAAAPEDQRFKGLTGWIRRLLGNSSDLSFDAIQSGLSGLLPEGSWLREVFDRYAVWSDRDGRMWRQDYSLSSDASLAFTGSPVEVTRLVSYEPITPITNREDSALKATLLAALNAAGIASAGLDETQILAAYNALISKPAADALNAANSKLATLELAANAAADAEVSTLAAALAVNSSLTVDDLKKLGMPRLKELQALKASGAAPVVPATPTTNTTAADEFAGYDINAL